jgi:hypothetical protein
MDTFHWFLRKLNFEISHFASQMDSNSWIILGFGAFAIGLYVLRGNVLRAS